MITSSTVRRGAGLSLGLASVLALAHCASDPSPSAAGPDDADSGGATVPDPTTGGGSKDGGLVGSGSDVDAGTIDAGGGSGPVTVCGGKPGDRSRVPVLSWFLASGRKYAVLLGAGAATREPNYLSSTLLLATGTRGEDTTSSSSSLGAYGPFTSTPLTRSRFVENALPETDLAVRNALKLGWSETTGAFYDLRTVTPLDDHEEFRVAGWAGHAVGRTWTLNGPKRTVYASDDDVYAATVRAARGGGWMFVVAFDHPCKAAAFDALVGSDNALDMLAPRAPKTRADVSRFLVDNDARLRLGVLTVGDEDPGLRAALAGTQASSATLDALEATMTAFAAAWSTYINANRPIDYAAVTGGTDPRWVVGSVVASPVSALPPAH